MILVLLGTQPFPFNRLIAELIAAKNEGLLGDQKVIVQAGKTPVTEASFEVHEFLEKQQVSALLKIADLVITHGGAGSIFDALEKGKKVIALARSAKLNEHVDEHQAELVEILYKKKHILGCQTLHESLEMLTNFPFEPYFSSKEKIINTLSGWINEK